MPTTPASVEEYVAALAPEVREVVDDIRATVRETLPGSTESISYQILLVSLDGRGLFYIAGWKRHVSVYPVPEADEALVQDMAPYLSGASTLKLPLSRPVPLDLVARVAQAHAGL